MASNLKRKPNKIAIAANVILFAMAASFASVFIMMFFPGIFGTFFMFLSNRPGTLYSENYNEAAFNGIKPGARIAAVEKALGLPLATTSFSKDGVRCEKQLCIYICDGRCMLEPIYYGKSERDAPECEAAYEVWEYTQPDPRAGWQEERVLKVSRGLVVDKITRRVAVK